MPAIYTDAQWAWIVERWAEGYTTGDVAAFAGVSKTTIRYQVQKRGAVRLGERQRIQRAPLRPLKERKQEFNRLE